jgi:hypothetical protein
MTVQITISDAAARYAAAGWPIHPLHDTTAGHCSCQQGPDCRQPGKHPRTAHGFHDATTDHRTIERWWTRWTAANIGVPTGPVSRLAVIDLDGPTGITTWPTLAADHGHTVTATADTPHGRHHWYRLPDGLTVPRSIRGLGDGIDLLGDDGYAIAPPSSITAACTKLHNTDDRCTTGYTWTPTTRRLAELPAWIPEQLEHRLTAGGAESDVNADRSITNCCAAISSSPPGAAAADGACVQHPRRYALAALEGEAERVARAQRGARNDTLNVAAWRLRRHVQAGALSEREVRDALAQAADQCGHATDDGRHTVERTITSALSTIGHP